MGQLLERAEVLFNVVNLLLQAVGLNKCYRLFVAVRFFDLGVFGIRDY